MHKLLIGLYQFDGPYSMEVAPESQPGVIAVLRHTDADLEILHLKASPDIRATWRRLQSIYSYCSPHELSLAFYYMPGLSRSEVNRVVSDILDEFQMAA